MVAVRNARRLLAVALVLLGALSSAAAASAGPEQYWNRTFGSTGGDIVRGMARMPDGSTVIIGYFTGTVAFGSTTLTSTARGGTSSEDVFVARLDANGAVQWAIRAGGTGDDRGFGVGVRADGAIFAVGYYGLSATGSTSAFGGENLPHRGLYDVFAMRLDPATGAILWATSGGGPGNEYLYRVGFTSDGGFVTVGSYADRPVFGTLPALPSPHPYNANPSAANPSNSGDMMAAKLDEDGTWVWARQVGGGGDFDDIFDLTMLPGDAFAITGYIRSSDAAISGTPVNAGPDANNDADADAFVARFDAAGNLTWVTPMGGNRDDFGYGVHALPDGSLVTTGYYGAATSTTATFGSLSAASAGGQDIYVAKLGPSGTVLWLATAGGTGDDYGRAIEALPNGSFAMTGAFRGTVAFGSTSLTSASAGSRDVVVATLSSTGAFTWAERLGGSGDDLPRGLGTTIGGDLTVVSSVNGTSGVSFGSTALTGLGGGDDVVVSRLGYGSSAPSPVTAAAVAGTTTATVEWSAPTRQSGPAVTGYVANALQDTSLTCRWTSGPLRCDIAGLTAGSTYTFAVTAEYADGSTAVSGASNAVSFASAPTQDDQAPRDPAPDDQATTVSAPVDAGRLTQQVRCVGRRCTTRGAAPRVTSRVVQRASRATGRRVGATRASACAVLASASTPRYRCSIRLAPGTWILTTEAWSAAGLLESAERRVVVRAPRAPVVAEPVTG